MDLFLALDLLCKRVGLVIKFEPCMSMKININKTECQFYGQGSKKFNLEVDGQKL